VGVLVTIMGMIVVLRRLGIGFCPEPGLDICGLPPGIV
jgi:hypothetical protein